MLLTVASTFCSFPGVDGTDCHLNKYINNVPIFKSLPQSGCFKAINRTAESHSAEVLNIGSNSFLIRAAHNNFNYSHYSSYSIRCFECLELTFKKKAIQFIQLNII